MAKKSATQQRNKKKSKKSRPNAISMNNKKLKKKTLLKQYGHAINSCHKFDILGRKRKGEEVHVGLSRSRGIEKRKKTLFKEYEQSWNASSFVDKRIGEKNEKLHEFDKGIMRSQRQRQRTNPVKLKWKQVAKSGSCCC